MEIILPKNVRCSGREGNGQCGDGRQPHEGPCFATFSLTPLWPLGSSRLVTGWTLDVLVLQRALFLPPQLRHPSRAGICAPGSIELFLG